MNLKQKLDELCTWVGIVGWVTTIAGAIEAIIGLFAYVIGALPGVITLILGIKLLGARKYAKSIALSQEYNEQDMVLLIKELTAYFKIQGLFIIIGFSAAIIVALSGFLLYQ
ncbi:DUF5362 family protein [Thermosediminibacter oceani]|uniref:Uncharacterized protein n=1 Tax=Thermosediminibacter oceani (strain ATCC BAA-1034 / DSM 16646 / JW/IW-1228P) TaxID=555079 RepID=D9RZH4_THEOJ|nr:hypothetical protein [Thermosediminibacter oceani]ADL06872.1 conserved hypothetical protein [Thermosediminibacter oceani DSM 16646]